MAGTQSSETQSRGRKLFDGTKAILNYRRERGILVNNMRRYIAILRQQPVDNYLIEVTLNVQSLKIQADKVKWAAELVAIDAKDLNYVLSKEPGYFTRTVPRLCDECGRSTSEMSRTLMDHIHNPVANTEHHIALDLERALANLGFA
ncbi:hypothetical protein N7457_003611 [Penicillium paradoxum]|uniref:uncharacterized protein n=1 Tax=Penicillium paradoxum TaxID=176176 RepID=UPI0025489793|nr:uncharacterized protein N7457_003611 [Penicillium paradoxum]KAJ5788621.1 hypothetical protein N7457_003611 [Penicillium paradoxum]